MWNLKWVTIDTNSPHPQVGSCNPDWPQIHYNQRRWLHHPSASVSQVLGTELSHIPSLRQGLLKLWSCCFSRGYQGVVSPTSLEKKKRENKLKLAILEVITFFHYIIIKLHIKQFSNCVKNANVSGDIMYPGFQSTRLKNWQWGRVHCRHTVTAASTQVCPELTFAWKLF